LAATVVGPTGGEIRFGPDLDSSRKFERELLILRVGILGEVANEDAEVRLLTLSSKVVHARAFNRVAAFAKTGAVHEKDGPTIEGSGTGEKIARRPRLGRDDCSSMAEHGIEERTFADVWPTDEEDPIRFGQMSAKRCPGQQRSRGRLVTLLDSIERPGEQTPTLVP
jgi:hypothetical protein